MNSLQWLQVLLSLSLQATLVIGVAWGMERWTDAAVTKSRVWNACFVSLLLLLAMGVLLPRLEWIHPWSGLGPKGLLAVANTEFVLGASLLAVWVGGVGVMIVRWCMQFFAVRSFLSRCPPYPEAVQEQLRRRVPAELLTPLIDELCYRESPQDLGPFCYQFHRPLVFLPRTLVEGDPVELEHVLRHELTHLKTQHPMQLFLQKAAQVFFWFHPLVWVSGRRSSLVREFVCDDAASGDAQSTALYLRTLLRLVENRSAPPEGSLMFWRSQSELRLRARRLAFAVDRPTSAGRLGPVLVCAAALAVSQLWLPTNPLASHYASYSPWPSWTATVAHSFGVRLRDFESYDTAVQLEELLEAHEALASE
ncbi:BlaR1 peptidase M56 [Posidoniimonas polymericola]|uniref:BlaR1 peptidase M56 n=1 Tax=Posidoniimonas polymericola TaxID=2528002 RepID=A0A5C5YMQ8_9BACT|nr:M56 family metallopeptidase [Posidoniimonas polymericola]TWT76156.1 BlaR1 peptidase M56 [Posidoniimonas polymericola]